MGRWVRGGVLELCGGAEETRAIELYARHGPHILPQLSLEWLEEPFQFRFVAQPVERLALL
jgi:hypothetical protein